MYEVVKPFQKGPTNKSHANTILRNSMPNRGSPVWDAPGASGGHEKPLVHDYDTEAGYLSQNHVILHWSEPQIKWNNCGGALLFPRFNKVAKTWSDLVGPDRLFECLKYLISSAAQLKFFERLIIENNLNPDLIKAEADRLGVTHRTYAQYGMKPQFLDLFNQHFLILLEKLRIEDKAEHQILIEAWAILLSFINSRIYATYANRT